MKNEISKANAFLESLSDKGAFLVTGAEKPNVMTIGWGAIVVMWGKTLVEIVVRQSRYTHELLGRDARFTVSIPKPGTLGDALMTCGTKSGRDTDKFALCGLPLSGPKNGGLGGVEGCALHIECRAVHSIHVPTKGLPEAVVSRYYPAGDEHTMYFGEILAIY